MSKTKFLSNSKITVSSTKRGLKEGYDRVTFIVKEGTTYKLSCIASIEDVFLKEIVNNALESFVNAWERKNHKIELKKAK